jgi:hypothetical protein
MAMHGYLPKRGSKAKGPVLIGVFLDVRAEGKLHKAGCSKSQQWSTPAACIYHLYVLNQMA